MKRGFIGGLIVAAGLGAGAVLAGAGGMGMREAAAPRTAAPAEAVTYTVDPVHSTIVYRIQHMGLAPFYGRFDKMSGEFTWDASAPESGRISITIDAASVNSNNPGRDKHLRNPDFFNTAEFPEITFVSKSIKKTGDQFEVTGDLTMLGKTKPITARLTALAERSSERGRKAGFGVEFTIKRSDFGMNFGVENGALSDEVVIMAGVEGGA